MPDRGISNKDVQISPEGDPHCRRCSSNLRKASLVCGQCNLVQDMEVLQSLTHFEVFGVNLHFDLDLRHLEK